MANLSFNASASLEVSGITATVGTAVAPAKPVVRVTGAFSNSAVAVGDYVSESFTVNGTTLLTALNLGKIEAGKALWLECSGPIQVAIEQDLGAGLVDVLMNVDKFIYIQSGFSKVKVANPSATAVVISVTVLGDRAAVGAGPGVW